MPHKKEEKHHMKEMHHHKEKHSMKDMAGGQKIAKKPKSKGK